MQTNIHEQCERFMVRGIKMFKCKKCGKDSNNYSSGVEICTECCVKNDICCICGESMKKKDVVDDCKRVKNYGHEGYDYECDYEFGGEISCEDCMFGVCGGKEDPRISREELINEEEVLAALVDAWNTFIKLPKQHPDEINDFADGIHKCQGLIGMRVARRARPDLFPIKE